MTSDKSWLEREIERVELPPFTLERFHRRRQRKERNRRIGTAVVALAVAVAGIGGMLRAVASGDPTTPAAPGEPTAIPTIQDVMELRPFSALRPGTYFIDPDVDPSTPLRVLYEVPDGWSQWIGAAKLRWYGHVGVSITTVTNVVRHGCRDDSRATVGPGVDDLAAALADLAPFRVTSPPKDVSFYGYGGKHLELTVPDLPVEPDGGGGIRFIGCNDGNLKSWVGAIMEPLEGDAFYGYTGPGYREEFWILDVDGTRLMIAAHRSPGAPPTHLAELRGVLDSIRIEP